ncbi:MAG: multidrug transporter subunit MdtD [Lactobacillus sp.]|jgi:EmrB/QacA subfamily drug resistance transporter|nr:multidrug transporter subunit MdtD [Lactobacillus sp.]
MIKEKGIQAIPPRSLPWLIAGAFFMQMLDGTILNTALPSIAASLGESPLEIQGIVVAYFLTVAFLLPLSGWLADNFGGKKVFCWAIVIFSLGSLFCALSNTLLELVLSRVFQAVGGAMMVPVGRLIVLKMYPKDELVKMLSFIMLPALLGPLLGPVLGGFLVEYLNWHWIFLINIPIGALCLLLTALKMPEVTSDERYSFDWVGFFLFSISIFMISVVLNDNKLMNTLLWHKIMLFIGALVLMGLYWAHAYKSKHPLFSVGLLKIRSFTVGALGSTFSRIGAGGLPYMAPLMLQVALGFSPSESGLMVLTLGIASIVAKSLVPPALKLLGYRKLLFSNTILIGSFICCFALIDHNTPVYMIVLLFYALGTANSLQFTSMATLSLIDLPKRYSSEGNSLMSVVMQISMSIGVSFAALVLNHFCPDETLSDEDVLKGFHYTYLIIGSFVILSSVNFLLVPKNAGGK